MDAMSKIRIALGLKDAKVTGTQTFKNEDIKKEEVKKFAVEATLLDGTTIQADELEVGNMLYIVNGDGTTSSAPEGTYETDDCTITVDSNGEITSVDETDEGSEGAADGDVEEQSDAVADDNEDMDDANDVLAAVKALADKLDSVIADVKALKDANDKTKMRKENRNITVPGASKATEKFANIEPTKLSALEIKMSKIKVLSEGIQIDYPNN